jgi:hypothetical protein
MNFGLQEPITSEVNPSKDDTWFLMIRIKC